MAIWRVFLISQKNQQHDIELSSLFCTKDHAILVQQWERSGNCQPRAIAALSCLCLLLEGMESEVEVVHAKWN